MFDETMKALLSASEAAPGSLAVVAVLAIASLLAYALAEYSTR